MAPERAAHARRKAAVWSALRDGIEAAGLPCEALPDGMAVRIDEHTAYEPDALVHCEEGLSDDAVLVPAPLIVVEVLSPSTATRDTGANLADYFRVPRPSPLPDRAHRSADDDPSPARRGRVHRDPVSTAGRLMLEPAGHRSGTRPNLRLGRSMTGRACALQAPVPCASCEGKGGGMAKTLDRPSLYDTDYVAWLEEQAAHLRAGRLSALDVADIAEELEGLARSDRHELANRLETLILHLLKWDHQPSRRSRSWQSTRHRAADPDLAGCWMRARACGRGSARWRPRSIQTPWPGRSSRPASRPQRFPRGPALFPRAAVRARVAGERAARASHQKEAPMTEHQTLTVRLHQDDNVVTARIDLLPKTAVGTEHVTCAARIPAGHKVATRRIEAGEPIRKYNQIIGFATEVDRARRSTSTPTMSRCATSIATTRSAPTRGRPPMSPKASARASRVSFAQAARPARATSSACSRP